MKTPFALAAAFVAAPLLSVSAIALEPEKKPADAAKAEASETAEASAHAKAAEAKAEDKRICRRIRLDISSRRTTKVCKTKEEWRLFNQRR